MSVCTFFGHRECPDEIKPLLRCAIENLILTQGVDTFYVGNQGRFDSLVHRVLGELAEKYPRIHYGVVLAYLPGPAGEYGDFSDTMVPEGIERVHPRYAIAWRNRWMLQQADFVIAYVTHSWGGAYRFAQQAEKQGKGVIHIAP